MPRVPLIRNNVTLAGDPHADRAPVFLSAPGYARDLLKIGAPLQLTAPQALIEALHSFVETS